MVREYIIKNIAKKFSLDETAVFEFISAVNAKMIEAFRKGKGVNIPEFGKFFPVNKTSGGGKIKTIAFSPSKKFADSVNGNYSDLIPELVNAGALKTGNEIRVVEVPYETDDAEFTYFVFDEDEADAEFPEAGVTDFTVTEIHTAEEIREDAAALTEELLREANIFLPEDEHGFPDEGRITVFPGPAAEEPAIISETSAPVEEKTKEETLPPAEEAPQEISEEAPSPVAEEEITTAEQHFEPVRDIELLPSGKEIFPEAGNKEETPHDESVIIFEEEEITDIAGDDITVIYDDETVLIPDDETPVISEEVNPEISGEGTPQSPEEDITAVFEELISEEESAGLSLEDEIQDTPREQTVFHEDEVILRDIYGETSMSAAVQQTVFREKEETSAKTPENLLTGADAFSTDVLIDQDVFTDIDGEILALLKKQEDLIINLELSGEPGISTAEETVETTEEDQKDKAPEQDLFRQDVFPDDVFGKYPTEEETAEKSEEEKKDEEEKETAPETGLEEEIEKKIETLKKLEELREELQKEEVAETAGKSMEVFEKLIDEPEEEKETEQPGDIIIHDPEGFKPASFSDALQEIDLETPASHFESFKEEKKEEVKNEVESYDDVFSPNDQPVIPQFLTDDNGGKKLTPGSYLKFFLYLFFVFLLATFSFYIYKKVLLVSDKPFVIDSTLNAAKDSLKNKEGETGAPEETEIRSIEDVVVEREGDIIYRKMNGEYRIQINVFEKLADAERYITNLKEKNFDAKIERADMPMGKFEYRIVIGPFNDLEEAKSYYNRSSMILNFIKVITPANTGLNLM